MVNSPVLWVAEVAQISYTLLIVYMLYTVYSILVVVVMEEKMMMDYFKNIGKIRLDELFLGVFILFIAGCILGWESIIIIAIAWAFFELFIYLFNTKRNKQNNKTDINDKD